MTTVTVPHKIPTRTLDVRPVAPQDRSSLVLSSFDTLSPGDILHLVSSDDAHAILDRLREERRGLFEWSPIEDDPRSRHVEIARRPIGREDGLRSLTEALSWDHDRLDALEARAFAALEDGNKDLARRLYHAFYNGLNRHIRFEEELLFPVFEARTGLPHAGPTAVMRAEHRQIRMVLEDMLRNLGSGLEDMGELRRTLHELQEDHNRKEESILYPATDRLLTEAQSDALVAHIQEFPG
jgi:uncharacterized protein (DUF2249 family)/hemerythrin-like domain-containing protein